MPGIKITIPTTFTDTSLPVLRDDPLLTDGSLALLELANPVHPAEAGAANGLVIPNIAWQQAAAVLGSGTFSTLSPTLAIAGAIGNLTKGKIERSTQGGLHGIISQSTALASGDGALVGPPSALAAYLFANKAHAYYWSVWDRCTRINNASPVSAGAATLHGVLGTAGGNYLVLQGDAGLFRPGNPTGSVRQASPVNAVGPRMVSARIPEGSSTIPSSFVQFGPSWGAFTGSASATALATANNHWSSFVFYRMYLEDLTVSGRSYAEVDALDFAEYSKQVVNSGGRYYGDSFTAPATLP